MAIPVILDTDIGTDIDDAWALAMLLRCPELDLRLVTTVSGDTAYRARIAGRMLDVAGFEAVPLALGEPTELPAELPPSMVNYPQAAFARGYDLGNHPGGVGEDATEALVATIMGSEERVTLIAIGPLTNVAAALAREPRITEKARLVAMMGSVRRSSFGAPPGPEYNVAVDIPACRQALAADWEVTIAPLDSCGSIVLDGAAYARIYQSEDPLMKALIEAYQEWDQRTVGVEPEAYLGEGLAPGLSRTRSSILFDTLAVYLAYSESLVEIESLPLGVEDDSRTPVVEGAPSVRVAVDCELERFNEHLTDRLLGPVGSV